MKRNCFTISTAKNRFSTSWQNRSVSWEELCRRFSEPVRTPETLAQWKAMSKEERTKLKDVGGFVGGSLSGGRRGKGTVTSRSLLTIDFDEGVPVDMVKRCAEMLGSVGYILHSTHSHTRENPRYRLIIPLSRDVSPEEYEPVIRKLLERLGLLDAADITTYEPSRLMYWASCPIDGEYVFHCCEGRGLDPDKRLKEYADWRDCTSWPMSEKERDAPRQRREKAQDPTEKGGLVGDFCRVYSVEDVLQMLSDIYEPAAAENRYTYIPGHVYGGCIVYDDGKFVHNHNQTNPAHGLCNAFDLYRIHRFGHLDDEAKATDDPTKMPSYNAMLEHLSKDEDFLARTTAEQQRKVMEEFAGVDLSQILTEETSEDTEEKPKFILKRDKKGNVENTIANAMAVLEGDPMLRGKIRYNEFNNSLERGPVPWNPKPSEWSDVDDARLRHYMERYGIKGKELILDAVSNVGDANHYHPVLDYLDNLPKWDGVERLDTVFIRFLGAEDSKIHRAMTRKQLVGAVRRIYEPGCKHDYCLVLSGPEGVGKSTILSLLASPKWFNDSIVSIEGKDAVESLQGSWIIEFAELSALNKSEVEMLKAYITKVADKIRLAYGVRSKVFLRQCVFFGTTNEDHFLRGDRGNRRFWIILINPDLRRVPKEEWQRVFNEERDQIWAEAKFRYEQGETNWLGDDLEPEARQLQEEFNEAQDDPLEDMLSNMLETRLPLDWHEWSLSSRRRFWQDPNSEENRTIARVERQFFCAAEYLREVECLEFGSPLYKSRTRKVGDVMRKKFSQEWEYIGNSRMVAGIHGNYQKTWKRRGEISEEDL